MLESDEKDNCGHVHFKASSVPNGHYLEEMQRKVCSTLYYKDEKKIAIAGLSSRLVEGIAQKCSKNVVTYEVVEFIHDILTELIIRCNI